MDDKAIIAKLIADLKTNACDSAGSCEVCGAPLFYDDDYLSGEDCQGCYRAMTDDPVREGRPCFAYRVGKPLAA